MITLVSSYINYYKTPLERSTHLLRLGRFLPVLQLKIPLVIFTTHDCVEALHQYIQHHCPDFETYIRLIVLKKSFFESSWIHLTASKVAPEHLPTHRFVPKDTFDFLCYSHTKIEFLRQSTEINPFRTTHFAWVDCDIAQMFRHKNATSHFLKYVCSLSPQNMCLPPTEHAAGKVLPLHNQCYLPGCWDKNPSADFHQSICWRFCGCFLLAHADAVTHLWSLYETHFESFLRAKRTMVWDVNFLAWLESHTDWHPVWFRADHNDSIVMSLPPFAYTDDLVSVASDQLTYKYPDVEHFSPSSASCVPFRKGEHTYYVMNTRYVNYTYLPSGHCDIHDPARNVYTRNLCCFLDKDQHVRHSKGFHEIEEPETQMGLAKVNDGQMFHGVEDIRLYVHQDRVKFIATTVNYSPSGKNTMMLGHYDVVEKTLRDCELVEPPTVTPREKNWIPLVVQGRERFVYAWKPFQIGEVQDGRLRITQACHLYHGLFQHYDVRGSSNFVSTSMGLVGVVHFSVEGTLPKQYYHMLVLLDADSCEPKAHSRVFRFYDFGVEFCLCMDVRQEQYRFWISRQDRSPVCITVPMKALDLAHSIETSPV